jgi:FkbM family methyltransferase
MDFDLISKHIKPDLVLDVGAHLGFFYKEAKQVWPDAEFYLFEANPECEYALKDLGVKYKIGVLSDSERKVTFYTTRECPAATGCSYYCEKTSVFEGSNRVPHEVKTITLDSIIQDYPIIFDPLRQNILLKIDCQGAELDILHGAQKTLRRVKAVVLEVAFYDYNEGAPDANQVACCMTELGYTAMETVDKHCHPQNHSVHIQSDVLWLKS